MLKLQLNQSNHASAAKLLPSTLRRGGVGSPALPLLPSPVSFRPRRPGKEAGCRIRASLFGAGVQTSSPTTENAFPVTALVTVKPTVGGLISNVGFSRGQDYITDLFGKTLLLDLVSSKLDPSFKIERSVPKLVEEEQEFPLKSKLDPEVYGPAKSQITKEIVEREIRGVMTVEEALERKKLFVLDYHDLLLPYVHKVRALDGITLYGSRTLFFLTKGSTLRPIAIELTRPKSDTQPQWAKVYTRGYDATECWLWKVAKAHVAAHDSGYHQLISHWLRTHCATEPYIIAANRQLSAMHPIYRLLHPHFRYTMEINALAREALVNAGGIIESCFSPGKYSIELSSVGYSKQWRFDTQSLPEDLISRGLAEEDPSAENGLKLLIEDYPYANDGLLLWSSIKEWVTDFVSHYYSNSSSVASDAELQSWWTEVKTKGHPDKKEGWPSLKTPADLVQILTTIIWVASGHHAAVNFGQYSYGGYFPNRPTIARKNMPDEDLDDGDEETFDRFKGKPEQVLLECFPSQLQATTVMSILDVLSNHSPDEEYLSEEPEPAWKEEPEIKAAFERYNGRMKEIEGIIDGRNSDKKLRNRSGAGIVPYTLLKPFSEPGVTGKGVPNSISI